MKTRIKMINYTTALIVKVGNRMNCVISMKAFINIAFL